VTGASCGCCSRRRRQTAQRGDGNRSKHDGHADHQGMDVSSFSRCDLPNGGESSASGQSGDA